MQMIPMKISVQANNRTLIFPIINTTFFLQKPNQNDQKVIKKDLFSKKVDVFLLLILFNACFIHNKVLSATVQQTGLFYHFRHS